MSKKDAEALLDKGGDDREFRVKYDNIFSMEKFATVAKEDGFEFTADELQEVLRENGDSFESTGNPPKKAIWI